ncbi:hypothetical protein A6V39_05490 [Candidatus Mycoplasma haematobovis]|uniref:Uncharacterized protein n=1 Tax=Candidatus Mycoplasma haematobovis TaxID=432608 RepID=A0A1A9QCA9_9MOLU|nr:hypothetical protein [Candidatus Mycoplasma haematobovis]OAL09724.1 hypothetical protein A6V39_05490 [Candidatus Mycoplasma haematobovis]
MIISTSGISSFADLYRQKFISPYTEEGQSIVTKEMLDKAWHIYKSTTNYLTDVDEPYWKNITLNCLDQMDHIGSYWVGEFDCHNEDLLNEIWEPLIKEWYFGKVWIIKSEEIMNQEIQMAESDVYKDNIPEEKLFRNNPFRLFYMRQKDDGKYYFKSLLTGIDYFDLDPKEMIYLSLSGGANFRKWWKINMEYVAGKSRVVDATKALSKTVQVVVRNQETFDTEKSQIQNPSVFYELIRQSGTVGAKEQNLYQAMPIIDGQRVKDMKEIIQSMYEKECEMLGVTINSNDKKERLTVAENYKDLRQVTNLQDYQLKSLKIFEKRLKDKGWVKENFKIEISGLTYAQGLPDTVQSNSNPQQQFNIQKPIENSEE